MNPAITKTTCNKPARLGAGAFGSVVKCFISPPINHPQVGIVAVKFPTKQLRNNNNTFRREKDIASRLHHPNIVETYADIEIGRVPFATNNRSLNALQIFDTFRATKPANQMVMEYCDQGYLFGVVYPGKPDMYSPEELMSTYNSFFYGVGSAIAYLHSQNIVHNDLKEENIYVKTSPDNPKKFILKIADFGLSYVVDPATPNASPYAGTSPKIGTALIAPLYFLEHQTLKNADATVNYIFQQNDETESIPMPENKTYYPTWFIDWYCFICMLYNIGTKTGLNEELTETIATTTNFYIIYNQLAGLNPDPASSRFPPLTDLLTELQLIEYKLIGPDTMKPSYDNLANYSRISSIVNSSNPLPITSLNDIKLVKRAPAEVDLSNEAMATTNTRLAELERQTSHNIRNQSVLKQNTTSTPNNNRPTNNTRNNQPANNQPAKSRDNQPANNQPATTRNNKPANNQPVNNTRTSGRRNSGISSAPNTPISSRRSSLNVQTFKNTQNAQITQKRSFKGVRNSLPRNSLPKRASLKNRLSAVITAPNNKTRKNTSTNTKSGNSWRTYTGEIVSTPELNPETNVML